MHLIHSMQLSVREAAANSQLGVSMSYVALSELQVMIKANIGVKAQQ